MSDIRTTTYPDGTKFGVSITPDFIQESSDFYVKGTTLTILTVLENYPGDTSMSSIEFSLLKPDGSIDEVVFNAGATGTDMGFIMSQIGDYKFTILLRNGDTGETYREEGTINSSDTIKFQYESCNVFSVENLGQEAQTVTYKSITGNDSGLVVLNPDSKENFTPEVGVTEVTVTEPGGERIFFVNNSCEVEECLARFIEELLCGDEKSCEMCPDETEVAQMMFFYNTYFMKVHDLFYQNSFFEALDSSVLDKVSSLNFILEKIREFCAIFNPDKDCSTCY
jgi:hypothetical protein